MNSNPRSDEHVGDLLSGLIDSELTQQDRQRVQLHIDDCSPCRSQLDDMLAMRERLGKAQLSNRDHDVWREAMDDTTVKASRGIGWLLLIGGALLAAGVGIYEFVIHASSMPLTGKLIIGGTYGGLLLIFISVLRQRLVERKTDRYKDVEI
jgi:anti-sigma factor RsiW